MNRVKRLEAVCFMLMACVSSLAYAFSIYEPLAIGCEWWQRIAYIFCHASVWHLLGNLYCLAIIYHSNFRVTPLMIVAAMLIAMSAPASSQMTVGMSGMIYALLGIMSQQSADKRKFHLYTLLFMSFGLFIPDRINNPLHLWCYTYGVILAML